MDTIQITKQNACAAHDVADAKGKKMLEKLFGESVFSKDIKDRVKTFEDACQVLGVNPSNLLTTTYPDGMEDDANSLDAYYKLIVIVRALNEGWAPDWKNSSERKFYPWFDLSAGSGLSYYDCAAQYSYSVVGSRLCFKNEELAKYAATQFIDLYNEYFLIK